MTCSESETDGLGTGAHEGWADEKLPDGTWLGPTRRGGRAQLRRARGFEEEESVLRSGAVELDRVTRRCRMDGREVELTRREFDLLTALLRYAGRIHTREQLLDLVWGSPYISPKTVDVNIAGLRRKLGAAITISSLRGVGYRLEP